MNQMRDCDRTAELLDLESSAARIKV